MIWQVYGWFSLITGLVSLVFIDPNKVDRNSSIPVATQIIVTKLAAVIVYLCINVPVSLHLIGWI